MYDNLGYFFSFKQFALVFFWALTVFQIIRGSLRGLNR